VELQLRANGSEELQLRAKQKNEELEPFGPRCCRGILIVKREFQKTIQIND
jgi:hypothetical protein